MAALGLSLTSSPVGLSPTEVASNLQAYLNEGDSLKMLVAGKMGTGKSSLINSIYGGEIAKEGYTAGAVTGEIASYTANVPTPYESDACKESTITFWDSPGFGDVFAANRLKDIEELKYAVDKVHVLVYCFDIRGRLSRDDAEGIMEITKQVSPDIWMNAVFVLTFCNELVHVQGDNPPVTVFVEKFQSWHEQITRTLRELAGVPESIVNNISIVPCGYRQRQPPGFRNWYSSFWSTVFEKTREDGQPLMVKLAMSRFVDNQNMDRPDLSELESPNLETKAGSCAALTINLYGDKEYPGLVSTAPVSQVSEQGIPPAPAVATPVEHVAVEMDKGLHISNEISKLSTEQQDSSIPPLHSSEVPPTGNPNNPLSQPPSTCDPSHGEVPAQPPTPSNHQPPPNDHHQPPGDKPKKKQFWKGVGTAGGVAGTAAAGALVGALIGIVAGGVGVGVGAAGGMGVGFTIGIVGLIAFRLKKYIKKKRLEKQEQLP